MSVQMNQYLMIGVKLPCDFTFGNEQDREATYEKMEPYMDSAFKGIKHYNGLCIVDDGMNGKYCMVGRVLQKSSNGETLDGPVCMEDEHAVLIPMVKELLHAQFGLENAPVKLWFFTHYR